MKIVIKIFIWQFVPFIYLIGIINGHSPVKITSVLIEIHKRINP